MSNKVVDTVERSVWTLVQGGTGVAAVLSLHLPVWAVAPVAAVLSVVKTVLQATAPVVKTVADDVVKVAPTVAQVAADVSAVADETEHALSAG